MNQKLTFAIFLLLFSSFALAEFRWGAGALSLAGHHYRGSDQGRIWVIPTPYFIYNTPTTEAEPSFIRQTVYENGYFSFKLSLMAGLNVESEKNKARDGMPDLDYTFEGGPMLIIKLWQNEKQMIRLNLEAPLRAVFSTDLTYIDKAGLYGTPYLNFINDPNKKNNFLRTEFSIGPMFGDKDYHQYFFGVEKKYETASRRQYNSKGGYSGMQATILFKKRWDNLVLIPFLRWDYLKGAVFDDSPLVKQKNYVIGGIGTFWLF